MNTRAGLQIMLVVSILICVWDVYSALFGHALSAVAWALGVMMAIFAIWIASRLIRGDYSR